ncbi:MAG TPA: hypothetical protein VMY37_34475 [Thermoguttaceae bacterium]|nr:hypothetical protein [Thermoguttaceae bacterium]
MKTATFSLALMLLAGGILAFAQDYYGAPYPTNYHSSTAAEGALRGMGDLARSAGEYNLTTSQAAINMTEAQKKDIENRDQWTNTYFQMREANKEYRAQERGPRPSMESMVRYAQAGKPKRLSPSEVDSVTGKIAWPVLLQTDAYSAHRKELEQLFGKRAEHGVLGVDDQLQIRKTTTAMLAELKGQIRDVPQMDYIAARRFVESLAYEATAPST